MKLAYAVWMMRNRSVPVDTVLPHIFYENLGEAIEWLTRAFGFVEHYRYGDPISGAQMRLGNAYVMFSEVRLDRTTPCRNGFRTQSLTVFVEDADAHFERAKAAGAKIVEELHETMYGELQYGAEDLEGHLWLFSRHARDVGPEEWGAVVANG